MRALVFAVALFGAAPAFAQTAPNSLTLVDATRIPTGRTIIDGANWRCAQGGVCIASGGADQPALRACRRVVSRIGAVSQFSWKGTALTAEQIAACNA